MFLAKSWPHSHSATVSGKHMPSNSESDKEWNENYPELVALGKRIQAISASKKDKSSDYKRVLLDYLLDQCFSLLP